MKASGRVEPTQVSHAQRAVGAKRGCRGGCIAPVAGHGRRRTQADAPDLLGVQDAVVLVSDGDLDATAASPDAGPRLVGGRVKRGAGAHAAGFGRRVTEGDRGTE